MSSGGHREGAGRKAWLAPEDKRVQVMVTVSAETRERMRTQADQRGVPIGRMLDEMFK